MPKPKPLTPLQIAQQQANAITKTNLDLIRAEDERTQKQAAARAAQIGEITKAIASALSGLGPQVQAGYESAGRSQATWARGYSDAQRLLQQQNAGETNAFLKDVVGAPSGQLIPGEKAVAAGDVLYGLGGAIPGRTFSQQGADLAAAAAAFPAQAGVRGQFLAGQELGRGAEEDARYQALIREQIARRPGLVQSALADIQKQRAAAAKLAAEPPDTFKGPDGTVYAWQHTKAGWQARPLTGPKPTSVKPPSTIYGPDGLYTWQQTKAGWQLVPVGPRKQTMTGATGVSKIHYYQGADGREHAFNPANGVDVILDNSKAPTKPRFTPAQIQGFKSTAAEMAQNSFYGVKDAKTGAWLLEPQHYQAAMIDLLAEVPLQIAQQALNKYWKRPGFDRDVKFYMEDGKVRWYRDEAGRGRPTTPYQQRQRQSGRGGGGGGGSPLGASYNVIGTPGAGTHTLGNWESDAAVDLSAPVGTPVYALFDGEIGSQWGALNSTDPAMAGLRLHLLGQGDELYYAHLSRLVVHPGQHVRRGDLIGYSGSANGVPHLHLAARSGDPRRYL